MKRLISKVTLTIILALSVTGTANAYECGASSLSAFGIGFSPSKSMARRIAIDECRMRTPFNQRCFVDYCVN